MACAGGARTNAGEQRLQSFYDTFHLPALTIQEFRAMLRQKLCNPSSRALFNVFIQPSLSASSASAFPSPDVTKCNSPQLRQQHPRNIYRYAKPVREGTASSPRDLHTLDEDIQSLTIHYVDHNNALQRNVKLRDTLRNLDRDNLYLRQVSTEASSGIPICKTISKKQLWEEAKAKEKEKKRKDVSDLSKQIELSWGIDPNDLSHRLKRLQEFLREGRRVEVLVAAKKRGRRADVTEMEELLRKVEEAVGEVEGAEEWKDMVGGVGQQTILYYQGDRDKAVMIGEDEGDEGEQRSGTKPVVEDKQAKKEREKKERKEREEKRLQRKREENESREKAKQMVL